MRTKLIGLGAAGNKAAICAVENEVMDIKNVLLLNSTLKDIPANYQAMDGAVCVKFLDSYGGCGKERKMSRELCENTLREEGFDLEGFLEIDTPTQAELVVLVTSTEGGTGSGSTPLLAQYISQCFGIAVHVFGFAGFNDDIRGMANTVAFFKDLSDDYTVECISNQKFLKDCQSQTKAETFANLEFCKKISVLMGLNLRDSDHNIDDTDLLKLATTPGYMVIEAISFDDKIKNAQTFEDKVVEMIDNSKALDPDSPLQKRVGIIINIKPESQDYINYDKIISRYGIAFEKFVHIQYEPSMPEFVQFISAGIKMPSSEVESIYNTYKSAMDKLDKSKDSFFDKLSNSELEDDSAFSLNSNVKSAKKSKMDFFKDSQSNSELKSRATNKIIDPADEF